MACERRYKLTLDLENPDQGLSLANRYGAPTLLVADGLDASSYLKYQELVANAIPVELERPSVIVNVGNKTGYPVILVGGMGPLSDASVLEKLSTFKGFLDKFDVTVLSMPPPRSALQANRVFDHFSCLRKHIESVVRASRHDDAVCFLTSNTAHTAFKTFQFMLTRGIDAELVNVVARIAEQLRAYMLGKDPAARLVLLTTYVSWKARLYEDLLRDVNVVRVPDVATAQAIQEAVVAGKANKPDMSVVFEYLDGLNLVEGDVVFFGCTDFTFLDDDVNGAVRKRYPGVESMDTDELFPAQILAVAESRLAASRPEQNDDPPTNSEAVDQLQDYFPDTKDLEAVVSDKVANPDPEPYAARQYGAATALAAFVLAMAIAA